MNYSILFLVETSNSDTKRLTKRDLNSSVHLQKSIPPGVLEGFQRKMCDSSLGNHAADVSDKSTHRPTTFYYCYFLNLLKLALVYQLLEILVTKCSVDLGSYNFAIERKIMK